MKVINNIKPQQIFYNHFRILQQPQQYKVEYTRLNLFYNRIRRCEMQLNSFKVIYNPYTRLLHLFQLRGITDIKIEKLYHELYFDQINTINSSSPSYKMELYMKYTNELEQLEKEIVHYYDEIKNDKVSMDLNNKFLVYQKLLEYVNYSYNKYTETTSKNTNTETRSAT
jgi:hypothetical protein